MKPTAAETTAWEKLVDEAFALDQTHPYLGQTIDVEDDVKALKYSEDQPRDDHGRWGSGGSAVSLDLSKIAIVMGHGHLDEQQVIDYVKAHGKEYTAAPLPKDIEFGPKGQCYRNASLLVMEHPELDYVEGLAFIPQTGSQVAFLHAWAATKDGTVVDPTWGNPENSKYFGVKYDRMTYLKQLYKAKLYGVLGGATKRAREVMARGGL